MCEIWFKDGRRAAHVRKFTNVTGTELQDNRTAKGSVRRFNDKFKLRFVYFTH